MMVMMMMTMTITPTHCSSGNENAYAKLFICNTCLWLQFYPLFNLVFFVLLAELQQPKGPPSGAP